MSYTRTPTRIGQPIRRFCNSIVKDSEPVFLQVPETYDGSKFGECFSNVEAVVTRNQGERVLGWNIWQFNNVYVEAEAYAVWRNPEGELIDVTPQRDGEERVLFLEDQTLEYKCNCIPNRRMPLTDSPLAHELLTCFSKVDECRLHIVDGEMKVPSELATYILLLQQKACEKVGQSALCPCQSGLKYKNCCGKSY